MDFILGTGYLGSPPGDDDAGVQPFALGGDGDPAAYRRGVDIYLSAATTIAMVYLGGTASSYVSPIPLSASSAFGLSDEASAVAIGDKYVTAANSIGVEDEADVLQNAVLYLSAATGIGLEDSTEGTCRDIVLTAANSVGAASDAASISRDIYVSAASGLGLEGDPDANNFFGLTAANSVLFVGIASGLLSGTLASNSFGLTDLAQAVVWFPWRRAALTLPPGGGLPHS